MAVFGEIASETSRAARSSAGSPSHRIELGNKRSGVIWAKRYRQEESPRVVRTLIPAMALFGEIASETSRAARSSAEGPSHRIELGEKRSGVIWAKRYCQEESPSVVRTLIPAVALFGEIASETSRAAGSSAGSPSHQIELGEKMVGVLWAKRYCQEESPSVVRTLIPAVALFGEIASETSRAAGSSAGSPSHRIKLGEKRSGVLWAKRYRQEESPRLVQTLIPAVALFGEIASETLKAAESSSAVALFGEIAAKTSRAAGSSSAKCSGDIRAKR